MKKLFDLSEKVAVVTGGAGLLGQAMVKALAMHGARVYVAEIDLERAKSLQKQLAQEDLNVQVVQLDITSEASLSQCLKQITSQDKNIDIWVNNAYPRTKDWGLKLEKIPVASWKENVDQHLNGYCLTSRNVAEFMKVQGKGSIINTASIYGVVGPDFSIYEGSEMTMPAAYAVIKGGIINFTRYLAAYYGSFGVRTNTVSPGGVFDQQAERFVENYCKKVPLKRMASPEDVAGAVLFLASDASSYITGHNLIVDGGWTAI